MVERILPAMCAIDGALANAALMRGRQLGHPSA